MKNTVKLIIAFVLGIAAALAVVFIIIPIFSEQTEETEPVDVQAEISEAVDAALKEAMTTAPPAETEPAESQTQEDEEPAETKTEITSEPDETSKKLEETTQPVSASEPANSPAAEPVTTQSTPSAQVTAAEPEYFYDEDGKRYVYINGYKTYYPEGDEPNVRVIESYNPENDPKSTNPGPF